MMYPDVTGPKLSWAETEPDERLLLLGSLMGLCSGDGELGSVMVASAQEIMSQPQLPG